MSKIQDTPVATDALNPSNIVTEESISLEAPYSQEESEAAEGEVRSSLPSDYDPETSENVTILRRGDRTFYVVGTAHISQQSVDEVKAVIDAVKPDTVCVELCDTRYKALSDEQVWQKLDIFSVIKQGKMLYLLAHLALSSMQKRMGEKLGIKPGAEMIAAIEKAKEHDATLVMADRDVQITLKRTWGNLTFMDKMKVMSGLLGSMFQAEDISEEDIEKIKQKDQLANAMQAFAEALPSVKEPLIDERDSFLISSVEDAPGDVVVAVVGAGHVNGMTQKFGTSIDREQLNVIPPKSRWGAWAKWLVPLLVLSAFYVGYSQNSGRDMWEMATMWILPNAVMCALLTLLAGGKLLSAATGFVASPITSLNPTIGAGMAVGLTEAWLRKPTVEDAERIPEDVKDIKGVYRNPFTRVLLVAVMSNIGSALGAWAALAWLWMQNFFA